MFIKYIGHDPCVLAEYNGKRFSFRKNIPIEIEKKVYDNIILSRHISALDFQEVFVEVKNVEIKKDINTVEDVVNKVIEKVKEVKHKGKKKK